MSPLNRLMNRIDELSDSQTFFTSELLTRSAIICGCIPLEILAVMQNMIKLPFQGVFATFKVPVKIINLCLGSPTLKEYEMSLPGLSNLFDTVLKVMGYALGILLTVTLGILSPLRNFRLHVILGLATDKKNIEIRLKKEDETRKQLEIQREIMRRHIRALILAQRMKIIEKERLMQQTLQLKPGEPGIKSEDKAPIKVEGPKLIPTKPNPETIPIKVDVRQQGELKNDAAKPPQNSASIAKKTDDSKLSVEPKIPVALKNPSFFSRWLNV